MGAPEIILILIAIFLLIVPIWAIVILVRYLRKDKETRSLTPGQIVVLVLGGLSIVMYIVTNVPHRA